MKKIIITGANGFLGSTLAAKLQQDGYHVRCLVRYGSDAQLITDPNSIYYVDYADDEDMKAALAGYQIIIHTAALTKANNEATMNSTNVGLTKKLVSLANHVSSIRQFVFISSQAASGPAHFGIAKKEEDLCEPVSWYGRSKLKAEQAIHASCQKPFTIIRSCSIFGPGEKDFLEMFKLIKHHLALFPGYCSRRLNLIFVDDLVSLITLTLDNPKAFNQTFNASDGIQYTMQQFAKNMQRAMDTFAVFVYLPVWMLKVGAVGCEFIARLRHKSALINRQKVIEMTQPHWLIDTQKAQKILGFKPQWDQTRALKKTYHWYKEHSWL